MKTLLITMMTILSMNMNYAASGMGEDQSLSEVECTATKSTDKRQGSEYIEYKKAREEGERAAESSATKA